MIPQTEVPTDLYCKTPFYHRLKLPQTYITKTMLLQTEITTDLYYKTHVTTD